MRLLSPIIHINTFCVGWSSDFEKQKFKNFRRIYRKKMSFWPWGQWKISLKRPRKHNLLEGTFAIWLHSKWKILFDQGHNVQGGFPCSSVGKESACNARHLGLIPVSERVPWRRKWLPTLVFLKNPMTREAWWATTHGCKSWTLLSN